MRLFFACIAHFFSIMLQKQALWRRLGRFLKAMRLSERAREEQRRAGILRSSHSLHSPDLGMVVEAVADRLRALLQPAGGIWSATPAASVGRGGQNR